MKNESSKVYFLKAEDAGYRENGFMIGRSAEISNPDKAHDLHIKAFQRLLAPFRAFMDMEATGQAAVKIHPGEEGNTSFLTPYEVNLVVKSLELEFSRSFLTDTTVLYPGRRMAAPDYVMLAHEHGFGPPKTPPFLVADGLRGTSEVLVELPGEWGLPPARLAPLIAEADMMVVISHFKGHLLASFGGAVKNLGMGCASRGGKLYQHSTVTPRIKSSKCIACGVCVEHCPVDAISILETARIDEGACIGCGECLQRCPTSAIGVSWNQEKDEFMRRMSAYGAAAAFSTRVGVCVNFVVRVVPDCDCMQDTRGRLVEDLGIVASADPVAADAASFDLVTKAATPSSSPVFGKAGPGDDKFKAYHPTTNGIASLEYAERFGLGTRNYTLIQV